MALHLRTWALDAQIFRAEVERLAVLERNCQRPAVLVQAQFGRPRLRRCITHLGLLAQELGAEPRPSRHRSIAPAPTIRNRPSGANGFPVIRCSAYMARKIIGPPRGAEAGRRRRRRRSTMGGLAQG